jgi:hypothetical protein
MRIAVARVCCVSYRCNLSTMTGSEACRLKTAVALEQGARAANTFQPSSSERTGSYTITLGYSGLLGAIPPPNRHQGHTVVNALTTNR